MPAQDQEIEQAKRPPVKKRRAPKGEMRRAALLDAAIEVIARDGFIGSSMRDVAEMTGITVVGLLHHFPNKPALLRALLDRRDQRVMEQFGMLDDVRTLESFLAFMKLSMQLSVQSVHECQASMMITVESLSENHPAHPWYKDRFELTHAHAQAHLTSLIEAGEIKPDTDVKALAVEIFSFMDGLQIQWLRSPTTLDLWATFDGYLKRLADSIGLKKQTHP